MGIEVRTLPLSAFHDNKHTRDVPLPAAAQVYLPPAGTAEMARQSNRVPAIRQTRSLVATVKTIYGARTFALDRKTLTPVFSIGTEQNEPPASGAKNPPAEAGIKHV